MEIRKANTESLIICSKAYESKSLDGLKSIKPKWAYGDNVGKLYDYIQNPKNNEYTIFIVNTLELIKNAEFGEVDINNLFTGDLKNDYRIARILSRWENCEFVDPPCIGIDSTEKNRIVFTDGRHRTKLTYLLGHRQMPVAVNNLEIKEISKIIKLIEK